VPLEDPQRLVGGIPLGDAPQVQLHARLLEPDGPRLLVEDDLVVADQLAGPGQLLRLGKPLRPPGQPPQVHDRPDRHVEGPFRAPGHLLGATQDEEKFLTDGDRVAAGFLAQAHQFAGGTVVAHDTIEGGDALEAGFGRPPGRRFVRGIDDDLEPRAHVRFRERKPGQGRRGGEGRQQVHGTRHKAQGKTKREARPG
jgi:hypothetical protein